jgi:hypothetical protein
MKFIEIAFILPVRNMVDEQNARFILNILQGDNITAFGRLRL